MSNAIKNIHRRFCLLPFAFCLYFAFASCSREESPSLGFVQEIPGRDHVLIYRVRVPSNWIRRQALQDESLADTTKSLADFFIKENEGTIRIAIHNFPSERLEDRIPPIAQVTRWKKQFETLPPSLSQTVPQAFSGYSGVLFVGVGLMHNRETMMMGWVLQLAPEHYRALLPDHIQKRADVTIKALGPKALMEKHQEDIKSFARSFELIEEIPTRT